MLKENLKIVSSICLSFVHSKTIWILLLYLEILIGKDRPQEDSVTKLNISGIHLIPRATSLVQALITIAFISGNQSASIQHFYSDYLKHACIWLKCF